jgi:8-oxo-dGTP diphosphatase
MKSLRKLRRKIPDKLYNKIQKLIPIVCVDAIIETEKGILLGKRKNQPVKGYFWFIGGRVLYGETLEDAVERKVLEETGLKVRIKKLVGVYTTIFKKYGRHNINLTYLVRKIGGKLRLDNQHSEIIYITKIEKNLHPYVKKVLRDSGVFGKSNSSLRFKQRDFFLD